MATMLALKKTGNSDRKIGRSYSDTTERLMVACWQHNLACLSMGFRTPEGTSTGFFSPVERLAGPFLSNSMKTPGIAPLFTGSRLYGMDKNYASGRASQRPIFIRSKLCLYYLVNGEPAAEFTCGGLNFANF
jgi:hypothetical protein